MREGMDLNELEKLHALYRQGALTEAEYGREKQRLEDASQPPVSNLPLGFSPTVYSGLMNLALLFSLMGWILSLGMWIAGKNQSEMVRTQGKYIVNWLITWLAIVFLLFYFLFAHTFIQSMATHRFFNGWLVLWIAVWVNFVACPLVGGIKCLKGHTWRYPLSIPFFR